MISVIFVDDDPAIRGISKQLLEKNGKFTVEAVDSAGRALEKLKEQAYDVIVSEYRMPVMDGISFLKNVRSSGLATPFILFTGKGSEEVAEEAMVSGADFYLRKSEDPKSRLIELADMIERSVARKKTEESLALTNKQLRVISSATRHDINNKLTIVSGYIQIMKLDEPSPSVAGYITIMERALTDIAKLLRFSKEYEKIGSEPPRWQDVRTVIKYAVSEIRVEGIEVKSEVTGLQVYADMQLERVFNVLVDNAGKHGGTTSSVMIRYEERSPDLFIVTEDNGRGIPADAKERIFSRAVGNNGGLGLFLSRAILAATGLGIQETGEPGAGARFEIRVPAGMYRFS